MYTQNFLFASDFCIWIYSKTLSHIIDVNPLSHVYAYDISGYTKQMSNHWL